MNSDNQLEGKRITLQRSRPNPLFEEWLEELYEEAKAKKSKLELILKEALESLSKYPLPLKSGMECAVLKGFDKKLCKFMDKRIEVYNNNRLYYSLASTSSSNHNTQSSHPSTSSTANHSSQQNSDSSNSTSSQDAPPSQSQFNTMSRTKNCTESNSTSSDDVVIVNKHNSSRNYKKTSKKISPKNRKVYKPVFRSGSYALLVALLEQLRENPSKPSLQKAELIEKAQPHSEESFTRPKPDSFYTAWSNMRGLLTKGLVKQVRSKKVDYSLTDAGIFLATELLEDAKSTPTVNDIIFNKVLSSNIAEVRNNFAEFTKNSDSNSYLAQSSKVAVPIKISASNDFSSLSSQKSLSQKTVSDLPVVELQPGLFDVILLIDKQETGGVKNKKDPTVAQFNKYPDLKHEYRNLKVGDYTWIARHKVNTDQELVIPYVVERKRMDDLGHSIKDGRFHEQKFRLRKCGLANVLYLVENFGSNKHIGLPIQSLMQALANTRVQDGFKIYFTDSLTNTVRFLAMMTKRLTIEYKDKHLIGTSAQPQGEELMTFSYFNKSSTKNKALTVTETFIKLLLQLKGVSVEKALAITKVYTTPKSLINAYESCTQKEGESLLAHLKYGNLNRNVGPTVSKAVHKFFVWRE